MENIASKELIQEYLQRENFGCYLMTDETCIICFDDNSQKIKYKTSCGHVYCKQCLYKWLEEHSRCPVCRTELYSDFEMLKYFKKQLVFYMESISNILQALNRTEITEILSKDHVLNFMLDSILANFQNFNINGDTFHDYWDDFGPNTIIKYNDNEYKVESILDSDPENFRFMTFIGDGETEHVWKVNLKTLKKENDETPIMIKVNDQVWYGTAEDILISNLV